MAIGANLTKREQILAAVTVVAIIAIAAYWYFLYAPREEQLAQLQTRLESLEAQNRQARVDLSRSSTEQLLAEAEMYEKNLELIQRLVPMSNEVPALLESVSTSARRVGLDLASVEPVPVIYGEEFDTYRYKVAVIGGYHAIAKFLSNVGSLDRIVAPVGLELSLQQNPADPATRKKNESLLSAKFHIQTYVVRTTTPETQTEAP